MQQSASTHQLLLRATHDAGTRSPHFVLKHTVFLVCDSGASDRSEYLVTGVSCCRPGLSADYGPSVVCLLDPRWQVFVHVHTRVLTAMKTFPTSPLGLVARGRTAEEPRRNGLSSAEDRMRFVLAGPHNSAESSVPPAFKNIILIYLRVAPLLRPPRAGGAALMLGFSGGRGGSQARCEHPLNFHPTGV